MQPDQILATLDGDTRSYLQLLLQGAGDGLGGRGKRLSAGLRQFEPLTRDLAEIGKALAVRRENIKRSITAFKLVSQELGANDTRLTEFVDSSASVLGDFADQQQAIRESLQELPSTLRTTRSALDSGATFAKVLGPASTDLIPAAQALAPALRQTRPLFTNTTPVLRNQLRPFAKAAQTPVRHLAQAAKPLDDDDEGPARLVHRAQHAGQRSRLQPAGLGRGGLPVLARVAEPRHERALLQPGRDGPDAARRRHVRLRRPPASPRASPRRARSCARSSR